MPNSAPDPPPKETSSGPSTPSKGAAERATEALAVLAAEVRTTRAKLREAIRKAEDARKPKLMDHALKQGAKAQMIGAAGLGVEMARIEHEDALERHRDALEEMRLASEAAEKRSRTIFTWIQGVLTVIAALTAAGVGVLQYRKPLQPIVVTVPAPSVSFAPTIAPTITIVQPMPSASVSTSASTSASPAKSP